MIDNLRFYSQHTLFGILTEGVIGLRSSIADLVNRIALQTLLDTFIFCTLAYLHHNLFALGFVAGYMLDAHVSEVVKKVDVFFKAQAQRPIQETTFLTVAGGLLTILAMPFSIVVTTLYFSSFWGAKLYQSSLAMQPPSKDQIPGKPDTNSEPQVSDLANDGDGNLETPLAGG